MSSVLKRESKIENLENHKSLNNAKKLKHFSVTERNKRNNMCEIFATWAFLDLNMFLLERQLEELRVVEILVPGKAELISVSYLKTWPNLT